MKNYIKLILGLVISAFFLYITFHNMDFGEIKNALKEANYWWLVPSQAVMWLGLFIRAYRFRVMAQKKVSLRFWDSFSAIMIGYFGNGVLPARLGEFLKARTINQKTRSSFSISIGLVFLERILDLFFMLVIFIAFFIITLIKNDSVSAQLRNTLLLGSVAATIPFVLFFIILIKEDFFSRIFRKMLFFLNENGREKAENILKRFLEASHCIKSPRFLLKLMWLSVWVWLPVILNVYYAFFCFEDLKELPLRAAMLTVILIAIGITLPSSPGYIGPYHAAAKFALKVYSPNISSIGSFAIVLHISQMLPMILVGFLFFNKENLKLKEVNKMQDEE